MRSDNHAKQGDLSFSRTDRVRLRHSAVIALVIVTASILTGCGAKDPYLASIQIMPGTQTIGAGATAQFRAVGTYTAGGMAQHTTDITNQVKWTSTVPTVATIDSSGVATAVGTGNTNITANLGSTFANATLVVSGSGATVHDLVSMTIIPATGKQIVGTLGETAQFIAIGTFNTAPLAEDMTNKVTWISSDVKVATINASGLATAVNAGNTTITALATSAATGNVVTGTSDLTVSSTPGGVKLPTLTVYKVGLGSGTVTSMPAGIVCGTGAECTGNFVLGSTVTLTATPTDPNVDLFGGWSANCTPSTAPTTGGTCTIIMTNNDSVGAIFNHKP